MNQNDENPDAIPRFVSEAPTRNAGMFDRYVENPDILYSVIELSPTPMILTDPRLPDNPIVFTNSSFREMTGYSEAETIGRNCRFLQGPLTDPATVAKIRDRIADKKSVSVKLLNYRKDGSPFWNIIFISPVYSTNSELAYFIASEIDVTLWETQPQWLNSKCAWKHSASLRVMSQLISTRS